ncbi:MAG: T9SS type A sorting domain-containing protein [Candidatus Marinimicrobia bacterium]|nr:T9SS type A sorting domain-containing protein [Candidatus Neomarinimicrobiota bacterium]MCF7829065.1 T9SS type A sorting domain-containing protein [Candidatus Neomarinimicrobiota bacterium]MCF7881798.1 T9SS type A sorting domain-containing protein [Candidatus Neomarinimicrobiota bacterium]
MKKCYRGVFGVIILVLGLWIPAVGQTDLVLQNEINTDYVTYLDSLETVWLDQVTSVGGDTPETMKAHMGLALLGLAYTHVDGDTLVNDLEPVLNDAGDNFTSLLDTLTSTLTPFLTDPENPTALVDMLEEFFASGDYEAFRDSVDFYATQIELDMDEADWLLNRFFDAAGENLAQENFGAHLDSVARGTADFEFRMQIMGSAYEDTVFIFDRAFFTRMDSLAAEAEVWATHFEDGGNMIDAVMDDPDGDVMPGVNELRAGIVVMDEWVDSLKILLVKQPLAPLEADTAALSDFQDFLRETDALLAGEEYDFGPSAEAKTIKPLAILQNMPGRGLEDLYVDFYRAGDPAAYTFGGIFPSGLDSETRNLITADGVINADDGEEATADRLHQLRLVWRQEVNAAPEDPDAHLGLGLVELFDMVNLHADRYARAFDLLDQGRVDELVATFNWDSLDISDEMRSIDTHVSYYVESESPTHFILLEKYGDDDAGRYEIGANSDFGIVHVPVPQVVFVRANLQILGAGVGAIADGLKSMYTEMEDMFVMELDPSYLDFSDVESDSQLIRILEQSNPDFMTVTKYGVDKMHDIGADLAEGFGDVNDFFDSMEDLAIAMKPYETDFDMDGQIFIDDMAFMNDMTWSLHQDFAHPDSMVIIEDERVNLSAWFDDPPESFLRMWKNYVWGVDSTLGGLFPDRFKVDVSDELPTLPRKFVVYPAYPNPFNPVTTLSFDLPHKEQVSIGIFDLRGERVATLMNETMEPGRHHINWNAGQMPSGMYYARIRTGSQLNTVKLVLLK